jgi:subtilase family serine protease
MPQESRFSLRWFALLLLMVGIGTSYCQTHDELSPRLITQPIDDSKRVTLNGNIRPEVNPKNDRGSVPASLPMEHLQIVLRLPEQKQAELGRFLDEVQNPKSPEYHKWLTPQQYKERFSLAPQDIEVLTGWLRSEGFRVNAVTPLAIDFSGTAGEVKHAFRTQIHFLDVKGMKHIANVNDPEIPAALSSAISGIMSLNDFQPRPLGRPIKTASHS